MGEITLTDEQLDAIVTQRVDAAMAGHHRDMEALKANRDEILREKREQKERADAAARSASLMQAADRMIDQMYGRKPAEPAATTHVLSREDARDPAKYRAAKAAAQAAGVKTGPTVLEGVTSTSGPGSVPVVVESSRHIYVRRDVGRDPVEYKRLRRAAEESGRSLRLFESRNDLDESASRDPGAVAAFDAAMKGDVK